MNDGRETGRGAVWQVRRPLVPPPRCLVLPHRTHLCECRPHLLRHRTPRPKVLQQHPRAERVCKRRAAARLLQRVRPLALALALALLHGALDPVRASVAHHHPASVNRPVRSLAPSARQLERRHLLRRVLVNPQRRWCCCRRWPPAQSLLSFLAQSWCHRCSRPSQRVGCLPMNGAVAPPDSAAHKAVASPARPYPRAASVAAGVAAVAASATLHASP
mmetsp:Transcript_30908/g.100947  ORF Transcript_30908/g.100947 Transcript_30908/m.100947 type:complete len:218 (-) Transcript_30908:148-801(-)